VSIGTNGYWEVPSELQIFKDYVTDPANGIISSDTNDIEVLYVLPSGGFSVIGGIDTNGMEGPELPNFYTVGIADTPDLPSPTTPFAWTSFGTHSIYLKADPVSGALLARTTLSHEILHILTRERHTFGGTNDSEVMRYNLFADDRRITTAAYLSSFGYVVSSSYQNQEEKLRGSPRTYGWGIPP
jgi:hypothetical protein